jgi:hypothetical protein
MPLAGFKPRRFHQSSGRRSTHGDRGRLPRVWTLRNQPDSIQWHVQAVQLRIMEFSSAFRYVWLWLLDQQTVLFVGSGQNNNNEFSERFGGSRDLQV